MERIQATYWIETAHPLEKAVETLAGEQSCGTFVPVPGETAELKLHHGARVEFIHPLGVSAFPALPGASIPREATKPLYQQARIGISWPIANLGLNLPNLMATVAGNLFELQQFSGLRLEDVQLPAAFAQQYPGPQFGIEGTRQLTGVWDRPIIGTIIKPSVGLSPQQTALQVRELIEAGLDFIKDDELMGDAPHSPFTQRVDAVIEVIQRFADKTGKKPMFAFNLSGDLEDMLRRHDYVLQRSGTCVMASLNWIGLSALVKLRQHAQLPIHGHRNGWGLMYRSPAIGIDFTAYQKVWRLAGVDQLHTNGLRNKFCEADESVIRSIRACQQSGDVRPIVPVVSSGQWAGQAPATYQAVGNVDLMYLCGGGIMAHPAGIRAGVNSVQEAWQAAVEGISLTDFAQTHPALHQALHFFK